MVSRICCEVVKAFNLLTLHAEVASLLQTVYAMHLFWGWADLPEASAAH